MSLVLDPQTEQRIQQHVAAGRFLSADDLLNAALDTLAGAEAWSEEEKAELDRRYDEAMAACDRGEGIPGEKVRQVLAERRATRDG